MKTILFSLTLLFFVFVFFSCKKDFSVNRQQAASADQSGVILDERLPMVIVTGTDTMQAHYLIDGTELWRFAAPRDKFATGPVINGNSMYFTTTHTLYKARRDNQQIIWQKNLDLEEHWEVKAMSLALCANYVISVSTVPNHSKKLTRATVAAIDTATGAIRWVKKFQIKTDSAWATAPTVNRDQFYSNPVGDGNIYLGLGTYLVAIKVADGSVVFSKKITDKGYGIFPPCIIPHYSGAGTDYWIATGTCKNAQDSIYIFSLAEGRLVDSVSLGDGFCGDKYPFLCTPHYYEAWYGPLSYGLYINGNAKMYSVDLAVGGLSSGNFTSYPEISTENDFVKPVWTYKEDEIPERGLLFLVNMDGSKISGGGTFGTVRDADYSKISFAPAVGTDQYPEVDYWEVIVYSYWGTNFASTSGWSKNTSNVILNFVVINAHGWVMYSADSGMMN